jgi:Flp pilus assembly protein TadD
VAARLLFEQAEKLDPNFAMAYLGLGLSTMSLGEFGPASESLKKAFSLRATVSERERFWIESEYFHDVTGELEKATQVFDVWAQTYPRDWVPRNELGFVCVAFGQFDRAIAEFLAALQLNPKSALISASVVSTYMALNRLTESRAAANDAQQKDLDSPALHINLYEIAFLQNDRGEMDHQIALGAGNPELEEMLLELEAQSAAYSGQLKKARALSLQAADSAGRAQEKDAAARCEVDAALREALFGNAAEARRLAKLALKQSKELDVRYVAAVALAMAGDAVQSQALAGDLGEEFPENTLVQLIYLPALRAQLALSRENAALGIEGLQAAAPYELGSESRIALYPAYLRGELYLDSHHAAEAAAEFQKILAHRGIVTNEPIGALAHLQIGRAYSIQGDAVKAHAAYQDFLTLWKDADADIPILIAAKSEYAKLQ